MTRTVVGLFDRYDVAQQVIRDLLDQGFSRDTISIFANEEVQGAGASRAVNESGSSEEGAGAGAISGTVVGGALGLLVGAGLLAIPGIGPVLAAGPLAAAMGTVAATAGAGALGAGIGAATGGMIGALVGAGVPEDEAEYYTEGVRRGSTLVTVQSDDTRAGAAMATMQQHDAVDIQERGNEWRQSGWSGSDQATTSFNRSASANTRRDPLI